MIEGYFAEIERIIQIFSIIRSYTLHKKVYNAKQGYMSGSLLFESGNRLDFVEVKDMDRISKMKYRYQYMNQQGECFFRYDNAPHHQNISTFPHHKHINEAIESADEPTLFDVLLEIAQQERAK